MCLIKQVKETPNPAILPLFQLRVSTEGRRFLIGTGFSRRWYLPD